MQMQIRHLPKMGDFRMLPGSVYAQSQLKAEPLIQNLPAEVWGQAQPLPAEAPAAPGAVLPTNAPSYLFPVNQEAPVQTPAPAAETGKGLSTSTLVIGGLVVVGVIAAVALLKN
jgi:hypothetical protein